MADETAKVPRLESAAGSEMAARAAAPELRGEPALPEPDRGRLDAERIDAAVLAVLMLTAHREDKHDAWRCWKGLDFAAMDRLYDKGFIENPKSKAKSVMLSEAGHRRGVELLHQLFGRDG
jgi:hypothetical protein